MIRFTFRCFAAALMCGALAACATPPPPPQPVKAVLPPAPPAGEPPGIAGLEASQLRVAFGTPAFVREDGTSQLWRYDGASCKAFFFLYSEGSSLAVRHVETLPRGQDIAADAACLTALRVHGAAPVS
jgi:hypothetical protein